MSNEVLCTCCGSREAVEELTGMGNPGGSIVLVFDPPQRMCAECRADLEEFALRRDGAHLSLPEPASV